MIKLADFGLSRTMAGRTHLSTAYAGTPLYMAPEELSNAYAVTSYSDMYTMGLILWELATRRIALHKELAHLPPGQIVLCMSRPRGDTFAQRIASRHARGMG